MCFMKQLLNSFIFYSKNFENLKNLLKNYILGKFQEVVMIILFIIILMFLYMIMI